MRAPLAPLLTALLLAALALGGCASAELARVRDDVAREHPEARIGRGTSVSFGAITLGLARRFGAVEGVDGLVLDGVRHVAVATHPVEGVLDAGQMAMPARLRRLVEREGWEPLVATRGDGEATWVLVRFRDGHLSDLFVASFEGGELSLVRVSGRLDGVVRGVLRAHVAPALFGEERGAGAARAIR